MNTLICEISKCLSSPGPDSPTDDATDHGTHRTTDTGTDGRPGPAAGGRATR
ncbi:Uncharacterised protein [Actinomyces viscosus]|uniref:Uncharacterized protein n=1 Tax=Actinomyces viscosus TaxID=1656 RepID=A0A448PNV1_ACTVI|nr:Uncharacterised protein [Actinomyces viscosus]